MHAQAYTIADSVKVLSLLKEGEQMLSQEKTKIIAAQYFGDAFRLAGNIGFYKGQGEALRLFAIQEVQQKSSYNNEAMHYFIQSLRVWQALNNPYQIAKTYILLGDTFADKWYYYSEGLGYYKQALILMRRLGKVTEINSLLFKMTHINLKIGNITQATEYSEPLFEYYQKNNLYEATIKLKLSIAQYWADRQAYQYAQEIAQEAIKDYEAHGGTAKQFAKQMQNMEESKAHSNYISPERIVLMCITAFVVVGIVIASYFYARRQV